MMPAVKSTPDMRYESLVLMHSSPSAWGQCKHLATARMITMRFLMVLAASAIAAAAVLPDLAQLKQMNARFAAVNLKYDTARLSTGDQKALAKLMEAARVLNFIFMDQLWSGDRALY